MVLAMAWLAVGAPSARAAHAFVLIGRVRMVPIFRHIGIDLVLADDDEIHPVFDHRFEDIGPSRQKARDNGIGALQGQIRHLARSNYRHALEINVFFVKATGRITVLFSHHFEERIGWRNDRGSVREGGGVREGGISYCHDRDRESSDPRSRVVVLAASHRFIQVSKAEEFCGGQKGGRSPCFLRGTSLRFTVVLFRVGCISIGRLFVQQVAHEEILHAPLTIGASHSVATVGHHQKIKVLARFDERIDKTVGRFRGNVVIHLADDEEKFALEPCGAVDIRTL